MNRIKNSRPIFSENQINVINTIALIISYIIVGLILNLDNNYFGSASKAIIISLVFLGLFTLITELRKLNGYYGVRGMTEFVIGTFMFCSFMFMRTYTNVNGYGEFVIFVYQLILCLTLMIVIFSITKGMFKMIWSVIISYKRRFKNRNKRNSVLVTRIIFVLTESIGVIMMSTLLYQLIFII